MIDRHLMAMACPVFDGVVQRIIADCRPEWVFLVSLRKQKTWISSIFKPASFEEERIRACQLVVVLAEASRGECQECQERIERMGHEDLEVTAMVQSRSEFKKKWQEGDSFTTAVYEHAQVCHNTGAPFDSEAGEERRVVALQEFRQEMNRHYILAREFFSGAELFVLRKNYEMAAFHLHQSAEQILTGIILYASGRRMHTHNLDTLYRHAQYLLPELTSVFPRIFENDKKLFRLLQRAYSDTRYKTDYNISYPQLEQIQQRVKKIMDLCQTPLRSIQLVS